MAKGYVYILTNPCIQYTYRENDRDVTISPVKIGMAKDVEKRLGSLNTSLPENFVHHMSVFSNDSKALENIVHRLLAAYRIDTKHGDRTEFFRCSVEEAVTVLKQTAKDMHLKEYKIDKSKLIGRSTCKIKSNSQAARQKLARKVVAAAQAGLAIQASQAERKRVPRPAAPVLKARQKGFTFSAVGIPVGAVLQFTEGPQQVTVVDDKHVSYKGRVCFLSPLVREFMPPSKRNQSGAYQGPKYFTYNGKILADLRAASSETGAQGQTFRASFKNVTQLAKYIARRGGNEGAFGGILHYFSRKRPCVKTSKWRKPLEDIGVKFDAQDFVTDWQYAKKEV